MTTAVLKSTAAAALVMLSLGAQAESVTLNFDLFTPGTTQIPVASTLPDFVFSGAFVQTAAGGMSPGGDSGDPFIGNRGPNGVNGVPIEFRLAGNYANRYLKSLTFDLYAAGSSQPLGSGFSGTDDVAEATLDLTPGSSAWSTGQTKNFDLSLKINRIVFTPESSGVLALDNLAMVFYDADIIPNPTVPEPASYALVALALLAAGGASRRRKA